MFFQEWLKALWCRDACRKSPHPAVDGQCTFTYHWWVPNSKCWSMKHDVTGSAHECRDYRCFSETIPTLTLAKCIGSWWEESGQPLQSWSTYRNEVVTRIMERHIAADDRELLSPHRTVRGCRRRPSGVFEEEQVEEELTDALYSLPLRDPMSIASLLNPIK